jgi:hypothetical protein
MRQQSSQHRDQKQTRLVLRGRTRTSGLNRKKKSGLQTMCETTLGRKPNKTQGGKTPTTEGEEESQTAVATHLCQKIQKADFALNPKEAWSMVFKLMEGFQNHHKTKMPKNFKNKNGVEAKCDKDNANILNSPIYSLFNSGTEADPLALEDFPQYKVIPQLESHQATKSHEQ